MLTFCFRISRISASLCPSRLPFLTKKINENLYINTSAIYILSPEWHLTAKQLLQREYINIFSNFLQETVSVLETF